MANGTLRFDCPIDGPRAGMTLLVFVRKAGKPVAAAKVAADKDFVPSAVIKVPSPRLWSIDDPFLYDVSFELLSGDKVTDVVDTLHGYAGLRGITIDGKAVKLNGKTVFQRLVLDQGFYPDGLYTAPTDQALVDDITLGQAAGFNGARLHQKVFEERFLHHCDRLGYIVWGEFPDWGANVNGPPGDNQQPTASFVGEWLEAVERDYSHPAIVGWCPLNETWQKVTDRHTQLDVVTRAMFLATKAMDATRPVLDASGYSHRVADTDVWDSHDYEQDPAKFAAKQAGLAHGHPFFNPDPNAKGERPDLFSLPYAGQPYFVSEFGGIWWNPDAEHPSASWGYGERVKSPDEFHARFEGLCRVLLDDPNMFGYCYTQLTDVFQEQNGIYRFDRRPKFDPARIRAAQVRPAAIERD